MVEEIQNKLQLEVDKYKAVQKGECKQNCSQRHNLKGSYVYKYGFEYVIISVDQLSDCDTVPCQIFTEEVNLILQK